MGIFSILQMYKLIRNVVDIFFFYECMGIFSILQMYKLIRSIWVFFIFYFADV